jgi:hypothetical protein
MPIFESPDKGETVYVKQENSSKRVLYSESPEKRSLHDRIMENQLWENIRRAAETNLALQEALNRVKVTYYLTDHYEERYGRRKT